MLLLTVGLLVLLPQLVQLIKGNAIVVVVVIIMLLMMIIIFVACAKFLQNILNVELPGGQGLTDRMLAFICLPTNLLLGLFLLACQLEGIMAFDLDLHLLADFKC